MASGGGMGAMQVNVELFLEASGLPNLDVGSKSDPFAVIEVKTPGGWAKLDQTEVVRDSLAPKFTKQVVLPYRFEEVQSLRVTLWDHDVATAHDYLCEAEFPLGRVMGARGSTLAVPMVRVHGRGAPLMVHYTPVLTVRGAEIKGGGTDEVRFSIRAANLDKKDFGFWASSDPFYVFSRIQPDGTKMRVHESEIIKNNLNPVWKPQGVNVQKLCNGVYEAPLNVQVWDWDSDGGHDLIGEFTATLRELLEAPKTSRQFPLIRDKKVGRKGYVNSGLFMVSSAEIVHHPTFLEYIQGGCAINAVMAIDYTGSNGDPRSPGSLHFMNPAAPNEYLQAITSTAEVMLEYDSDKRVPVYGFGGSFAGSTTHCFPLTFDDRNPEVAGISGITDAYKASFSRVALSGPTYFAPIIRRAAEIASEGISQAHQKYTVLLLLTDGQCNDIEATTEAIIDASSLPLSIVIVGVGAADFSAMDFLDADGGRLSIGRKVAFRDIVQFVPFRKFAAYGAGAGSLLAKEVLKEVPGQLLAAMTSRGIVPNRVPMVAGGAVPVAAHVAPAFAAPVGGAGAGGPPMASAPPASAPAYHGTAPYPAGVPAAGPYPAGVPAAGPYPAGVPAAGPYPAGVPAAGPYPAGVPAAGPYPAGVPPAGPYPAGMPPAGPYPAGMPAYPAGVPR